MVKVRASYVMIEIVRVRGGNFEIIPMHQA